jgi:GT2 family glycosyltransferase
VFVIEQHTAVIIVSFGRLGLMRQTLKSLMATKDQHTSTTVIDNGSLDELVTFLLGYRSQLDNLVLLPSNRGKPYAWNLGVRIATEQCKKLNLPMPTHYLFCDNDISFKPNWNAKLVAAYEEHRKLPLCGLSGMRWPKHQLSLREGNNTTINITRFPPGCCVMISKEAFADVGDWDTKTLIRTVDTSYFRRAHNKSYHNASIYPNSVIDHTGREQRSWHIASGKPKLFP